MPYFFVLVSTRAKTIPPYDMGIEIVSDELKKPGMRNHDHHGDGATVHDPAAIDLALKEDLPEDGTVIAIEREDADSIGAAAVLKSRLEGRYIDRSVVRAISRMDRFGPHVVPMHKKLVTALSRVATSRDLSLDDKIAFAQSVLDRTVDREEVKELVRQRNQDYKEARKKLTIKLHLGGKFAVVVGNARFGPDLAYEAGADYVLAFNPTFPASDGGTYQKFTISVRNHLVEFPLEAILTELRKREPGWGGRGTILGSTRDQDTLFTVEEVTNILLKVLPS